MSKSIAGALLSIVLVVLLSHLLGGPALAEEKKDLQSWSPLLHVGKIGPEAVRFKVWTDRRPDEAYREGERVVIHLKSDKQCYLVVAAMASGGDVTIAYPNRGSPNNLCEAGKEYTLFGEESKLKLVMRKPVSETTLVFYVTAEPVSFVKIPDDQTVMRIASNASDALKALNDQLAKMAGKKGFNRKVLVIKTDPACAAEVEPMGSKDIPWTDVSNGPEPVTGAQGRTPDLKKQ